MLTERIKVFVDFGLGDGYIGGSDAKGYFLDMGHSIKQRDYLEHKVSVLAELGFNPSFKEEYKEDSYGKHFVKSRCYAKEAKTAHKYLYNKRTKRLDSALLRICDRKTLAYWFMDDGCVDHYNRSRTGDKVYVYETPFARSYRFATHSFSKEECLLFCEWMYERFNIRAKVNLQRGLPYINISQQRSKDVFRHIVEDYIVDSMQYKIKYPHSLKGIPYSVITP